MDNLSLLVDSLHDLMISRNIKLDDIYKATNVSPNSIYAWLRNEKIPTLKSLVLLADYFECSVEYLCGRVELDTFVRSANPSTFSERLRLLMKKNGVSQRILNADTKISTSSIHHFLTGTSKPLLDNLIKLSVYFDCSIDYLIGRED